jgi:alpha-tubulin suppressor-like RCC1 family protein
LGASCSCAKGISGNYIIRTDGVVLQMPTTATGAQTPVLDANTAQPITGVVGVYESYSPEGNSTFGCAVKVDGTVWCWRSAVNGNQNGGLGNGNTDTDGATFRATQVLVSANAPLTKIKSIAPSSPNAPCAITNDGNLYCWGDLTWLVGNGTSLVSSYAQVITKDGASPLAGVKEISVGLGAQCALVAGTTTNEAWCWGYNVYGNLGTGDTTNRRYPTKILGLTNPTEIAVSYGQYAYTRTANCAIDGGNVLCWGYNAYGATGVGNVNTPITVPTLVKMQDGTTPLSNISALYSAPDRFCALHTGNTVWCWGSGFAAYADNIGLTNIVDLGTAWGNRTWLTSDGMYHYGAVTISPKCGSLQ